MPINAPQRYYDLELQYSKEKNLEEKQKILKEMMRVLPKHKGSDKEFASLKRRMSLLKKAISRSPQVHRTISIRKRWPRVCLIGYEPSEILKRFNLTKVSLVYYGMILVNNVKIQLIVIPNAEKFKEFVNSSDILISKTRIAESDVFQVVSDYPDLESATKDYGVIGVYTENSDDAMAMMRGDTLEDLADRLGIKIGKGTYAIVYGNNLKFQGQRVGLNYKLNEGDRIFIKL
ncbi:TGS domain-containing protein [Candidatus Parvarchaeota archaeon]|jgi:ribosome-interacting GTPase 1|nr:TGS domain-containing protein [Candidatus Parvarchaeota archaeon]